MVAQIEPPVSTASQVEVGIYGLRLPDDGPATRIYDFPQSGAHLIAYDITRLTQDATEWIARLLFGDHIRIVTPAGA